MNPGEVVRDSIVPHRHICSFFFPLNGSEIDAKASAAARTQLFRLLTSDCRVDSIILHVASSPSGSFLHNRKLAESRGKAAYELLTGVLKGMEKTAIPRISLDIVPENWKGLRSAVMENCHRPDRGKILDILGSRLPLETKKDRLKTVSGGEVWRYLQHHIMDGLRYVRWEFFVNSSVPDPQRGYISPVEVVREESPMAFRQVIPVLYGEKTLIALKTNLLYDAVSFFNFALEFPFGGNRFSLVYDHVFPWWRGGPHGNRTCIRYLQVGGEFRWWFRPHAYPVSDRRVERDCLCGHFLGLYGMGGKYDFQRKTDVCYQGEFWSSGMTYGYSMPVGRKLNLEFSISAGYASIDYRHFVPSDDYSQLFRDPDRVGTWEYWGITKAGVSLVLPIRHMYKKGGGS